MILHFENIHFLSQKFYARLMVLLILKLLYCLFSLLPDCIDYRNMKLYNNLFILKQNLHCVEARRLVQSMRPLGISSDS